MKKYLIGLIVGALITIPVASYAQTASLWKLLNNTLQPVLSSWSIQVPSLGTAGNPCLTVSNTGVFSTQACGGGGGTNFFTQSYNTINQNTGSVISGGSFTATSTTATSTIAGGLTVGTNKLVVNNFNGNVGIGTTTPATELQVNGGGQYPIITFGNSTAPTISHKIGRASNFFGTAALTDFGINAASTNNLVLGANNTEIMRLTSGGNVGIGTTTPDQKLSIYNATTPSLEFSLGAGTGNQWTEGIDTSNGNAFEIASSSALGTNPRLVINGAGNVGIGTTVPLGTLQVGPNANSTTHYMQFFGAYDSTAGYPQVLYNNPGTYFMAQGVSTAGDMVFGTANAGSPYSWVSQQMVLQQTTGHVGIGTSTPDLPLQVVGAISSLKSTIDDSRMFMIMTSSDAQISATYKYTGSYRPIDFRTSDTTRMTLATGGQFGIGTTTPSTSAILDVTEASTSTVPYDVLIGTPNVSGGAFVTVDADGTHSTCTEWYSVGGVGLTKAVTCPTN